MKIVDIFALILFGQKENTSCNEKVYTMWETGSNEENHKHKKDVWRLEWFHLILKIEILNAKAIFWISFSSSLGMFSKYYFEKLQNKLDFAQYLGKCMCVSVKRWGCITLSHEVCLTPVYLWALWMHATPLLKEHQATPPPRVLLWKRK